MASVGERESLRKLCLLLYYYIAVIQKLEDGNNYIKEMIGTVVNEIFFY